MKKLIFIFFIVLNILHAEPSVLTDEATSGDVAAESTDTQAAKSSNGSDINTLFSNVDTALDISFVNPPSRAYMGEIIALSVKLTPVDLASGNIEYTLQNEEGLRIFSDTPRRSVKSDGVYDTFYFLVQAPTVRLPDITATLTSTGAVSKTLNGTSVAVSSLNPPPTYANVLADSFEIINYKTTPYDGENNVVIFTAKASRCNIADFSINNAVKQGFESKLANVNQSQITYYVIIPKSEQSLNFSYFNLKKQRFESLMVPIVVDDDTVSTQSDLTPTDDRHTDLKASAAGIAILLLSAMFYWRKQKWYLYLTALPVFYLIVIFMPNEKVCVKKDAPIYLLPINHGTIFEMTTEEESLESEKQVGDFFKVHLKQDRVGWVNKRDLCSN
ncbi:MAG: hypothetical protein AB7S65_09060 [Sulfuricurvum sp.]